MQKLRKFVIDHKYIDMEGFGKEIVEALEQERGWSFKTKDVKTNNIKLERK